MDKTIADFGFVLKDLETSASKDVKMFIDKSSSVLGDGKHNHVFGAGSSKSKAEVDRKELKVSSNPAAGSKYSIGLESGPPPQESGQVSGNELNFTSIAD